MPGWGAYPNQSARITRAALTRKPEDGVRAALSAYFFGGSGVIQPLAGSAAGLAITMAVIHILRPISGDMVASSWMSGVFTRILRLSGFASAVGANRGSLSLARMLTAATVGAAAVRAQFVRLRALIGRAAAGATLFARVAVICSLVGRAAGWSALAGLLVSAVRTALARTLFARREARTVVIGDAARTLTVSAENRKIGA